MSKDLSDVLPVAEKLEGERIEKDELVGKKFEVVNFVLLPSSFEGAGEFTVVQAKMNGKLYTFSAGQVISKKLVAVGIDNLPFTCKMVQTASKNKGRKYYDLQTAK
jgi:hypothetical protein